MTAHRACCLALLIATVALGSARAGCVSQTARPSDINTSALALYDLKGVYQRHIRTDSLPASFTVQECGDRTYFVLDVADAHYLVRKSEVTPGPTKVCTCLSTAAPRPSGVPSAGDPIYCPASMCPRPTR